MDLNRQMKTDRRLWLLFTVAAFVPLSFYHLLQSSVEGKSGRSDFWGLAEEKLNHPGAYDSIGALIFMALYGAFLAFLAAIVGWATQAIVVAVKGRPSGATPTLNEGEPCLQVLNE